MNQAIAKAIRTLTVAPIVAAVTVTILYFHDPALFGGLHQYVLALVFLTALPLSAYPLQPLVPGFKGKGREGQRNLAIVMAVVGYVCGVVFAAVSGATQTVWLIYLTYMVSGVGIVLFNKVLKIRASGHACGIAGPIALLYVYIGPLALFGVLVLVAAIAASLGMKRHTLPQMICGSLISLVSLALSYGGLKLAMR